MLRLRAFQQYYATGKFRTCTPRQRPTSRHTWLATLIRSCLAAEVLRERERSQAAWCRELGKTSDYAAICNCCELLLAARVAAAHMLHMQYARVVGREHSFTLLQSKPITLVLAAAIFANPPIPGFSSARGPVLDQAGKRFKLMRFFYCAGHRGFRRGCASAQTTLRSVVLPDDM